MTIQCLPAKGVSLMQVTQPRPGLVLHITAPVIASHQRASLVWCQRDSARIFLHFSFFFLRSAQLDLDLRVQIQAGRLRMMSDCSRSERSSSLPSTARLRTFCVRNVTADKTRASETLSRGCPHQMTSAFSCLPHADAPFVHLPVRAEIVSPHWRGSIPSCRYESNNQGSNSRLSGRWKDLS